MKAIIRVLALLVVATMVYGGAKGFFEGDNPPTQQDAPPPRSEVASPTASQQTSDSTAVTCRNDNKVLIREEQPGRPFKVGVFTITVSSDVKAYVLRSGTDPVEAYSDVYREAKPGELIRAVGVIVSSVADADAPTTSRGLLAPENLIGDVGLIVGGDSLLLSKAGAGFPHMAGQSNRALFAFSYYHTYYNIDDVPRESLMVYLRFQPGLLQQPSCSDYVEWRVPVR